MPGTFWDLAHWVFQPSTGRLPLPPLGFSWHAVLGVPARWARGWGGCGEHPLCMASQRRGTGASPIAATS